MRNSRAILGLVAMVCLAGSLRAQSFEETALLFSRTTPGGSARMQAMGGVQIGLGADYSSALSNPAGLGMYNRSELVFSPAFSQINTDAEYLGISSSDKNSRVTIPGLGLIFHNSFDKTRGILGGTFAIALSRTNDFNRNIDYQGTNSDNSIIDYFIEQATGDTEDQFDSNGPLFNTPTELGYNNFLIGPMTVIDPNGDPTQYFTDVLGIPFQKETIQTRGGQSQWNFSYGANLNDRLFFGVGVGVTNLRYRSTKVYREEFENEPLFDLQLEEKLEIKGSGINATIGAIYRPVDFFQIGFSATTPTRHELTDAYSAVMRTNWDNFQYDPNTLLTSEEVATEVLTSDYILNTPGKMSLGATAFIGKWGFISADVERIHYGKAKYKPADSFLEFDSENSSIRNLYQDVYNLRLGGEVRVEKFRFRGGFSYMPEAYKTTQNNIDQSIQTYSAGIGYRTGKFYIDGAYVFTQSETPYRPYTVNTATSPLANFQTSRGQTQLTVGLLF